MTDGRVSAMEATIIIELLRDAFALIEFVQTTAATIRNHEEERSDLNLKFRAQELRLRQLYRLFEGADEDLAVIARLGDVPEENLRLVRDYLVKLQRILVEYKNAATTDREYRQRVLPEVADQPSVDEPRPSAAANGRDHVSDPVEDATAASDKEKKTNTSDTSKPQQEPDKATKWKMTWMPGWDRFSRRRDVKPKAGTDSARIKTVAKGLEWLFQKDKLEALLVEFTLWNDELQKMIPFVLSGMKQGSDGSLFNMLGRTDDETTDLFAVHVELRRWSPSGNMNKNSKSLWVEVKPMAWEKAQSEMKQPQVLVEYKDGPSSELVYAQQLAWLLKATNNHKFNTLPFKGFAKDPSSARYAFLFDHPKGATEDPISLYDLMQSGDPRLRMNLKQRFHVARTVAASIGTFHADGWYHKSIRSQAIKFFFKPGATTPVCDFGSPYLTEFGSSRPESGQSLFVTAPTVQDIDRDLYLHPDRYGGSPKPFIKIYDIYSLGVVLLEIGLWQTAKQIHDKIAPQVQQREGPGAAVSAAAMKQAYLQHARTRLDHRMGIAYREAVEHCLEGSMEEYLGSDRFSMQFHELVLAKVDIERLIHDT